MRRVEPSDHATPMTESELQGHIIKMAQAQGWWVKPAQQGSQEPGRRKIRNGTAAGFPDLVLARNGQVMFWELKDQKGSESQEQVNWSLQLPCYEVIRPSDLARGRVDELLA